MKRFETSWCLLTLGLAGARGVLTQEIAGSIRGTVVDGSGGIVSGVKVTPTQAETELKRSVVSDAQGVLVELPVGHYLLEAEAQGFKKYPRGTRERRLAGSG